MYSHLIPTMDCLEQLETLELRNHLEFRRLSPDPQAEPFQAGNLANHETFRRIEGEWTQVFGLEGVG